MHGTPKPPKSQNYVGKTPIAGLSTAVSKLNTKEFVPKPLLNVKALADREKDQLI